MNKCAVLTLLVVAISGYVQIKNQPNKDLMAANSALQAAIVAEKEKSLGIAYKTAKDAQAASDALKLALVESTKALEAEKKRKSCQ